MTSLIVRGFKRKKYLMDLLENAVGEFKGVDPNLDISVCLDAESRRKRIFRVSMVVRGASRDIVMTRYGNGVHSMVQHAKKDVVRQLHELKDRELGKRSEPIKVA